VRTALNVDKGMALLESATRDVEDLPDEDARHTE
jgi:hypothetical protein